MKTLMILPAIAVLLFAGCAQNGEKAPDLGTISADAPIIDVRTPEEFARGHVEGAMNIPVGALQNTIEQKVPNKSAPVYVYCESGRRAGIAEELLQAKGYRVQNLGSMENAKKLLKR